jgi:hypothetical protein
MEPAGQTSESLSPATTEKTTMTEPRFPPGWNAERVQRVLEHYENQTEDEAVAEDEHAFAAEGQTVMVVPTELVPEIRELIARRLGA